VSSTPFGNAILAMPATGSEAVASTSNEPDSSVFRKISVPTTCAYGLDSSRVSAGAVGSTRSTFTTLPDVWTASLPTRSETR
jgi:hypothetical protein